MLLKLFKGRKKTYKIEFFYEIEEMPMDRFSLFTKYMLLESHIGADLNSFAQHGQKIKHYARTGDFASLNIEVDNQLANLYFIQEKFSPKYSAFVVRIKTINGEPVTDLTEEGIKRVQEMLNKEGITLKFVDSVLTEVQKKNEVEINTLFEKKFGKSAMHYRKMISIAMMKLDGVINEKDNEEEVQRLEFEIAGRPVAVQNIDVGLLKNYRESRFIIADKLKIDPEKITVLDFYQGEEFLKKNQPKQQNQNKRDFRDYLKVK